MADEVRYAVVDYDVHGNNKAYSRIYKHLRKVAIMFTESVYMVNIAQAVKVHDAFTKINKDLEEAGLGTLQFDTLEIAEREFEKMRNRSVSALTLQVQEIVNSLHKSIEVLEVKYDPKVDDPNDLISERKVRVAKARNLLKQARGVAMLFLIDKDVNDAVSAADLVIEAQKAAVRAPPKAMAV